MVDPWKIRPMNSTKWATARIFLIIRKTRNIRGRWGVLPPSNTDHNKVFMFRLVWIPTKKASLVASWWKFPIPVLGVDSEFVSWIHCTCEVSKNLPKWLVGLGDQPDFSWFKLFHGGVLKCLKWYVFSFNGVNPASHQSQDGVFVSFVAHLVYWWTFEKSIWWRHRVHCADTILEWDQKTPSVVQQPTRCYIRRLESLAIYQFLAKLHLCVGVRASSLWVFVAAILSGNDFCFIVVLPSSVSHSFGYVMYLWNRVWGRHVNHKVLVPTPPPRKHSNVYLRICTYPPTPFHCSIASSNACL